MREMKPERKKKEKNIPAEVDLPLGELQGEERIPEEEMSETVVSEEELMEETNSEEIDETEELLKTINERKGNLDDTEDSEKTGTIKDVFEEISEEMETEKRQLEEDRDPEYEARRAARLERRMRKLKKQRRKKIAAVTLTVVAATAIGAGFYFKDDAQSKIGEINKLASNAFQSAKDLLTPAFRKEKEDKTPEVTPIPEVTPTPEAEEISPDEKKVLVQAKKYAQQYDYDAAVSLLKESKFYDTSAHMRESAEKYQQKKEACVSWPLEEVTHIFYHSLIVDPSRAFDGDNKQDDYNQVMTTMDEFNKITQIMYDKGYVMVSMKDMAKVDENGNVTPGEILLPPGKVPFVLSQDDTCYYHYMDGDGYASKLVVDEDGKVRNEYIDENGNVSVGDYDVVPLIDRFVEEHPDFSYRGAKGILALTGYNGILGYRSDISYETRPDDLDLNKVQWLDAHPEFDLETERAGAKKVADAMKENGWEFASHTWGHLNIQDISMERLERDTQRFKENVDPLIGGTDTIIFAFGTDLTLSEDYSGEKFEFLKNQGYHYFCNVDSQKYFVQIRDNYFRMGRRNLDGYRMYYHPELVDDLFDAGQVFDSARPVPVPEMGW